MDERQRRRSRTTARPLNAIFAEDFVELLIPVMSNNTMAEVAEAVAHHTVGVRVRDRGLPKMVVHNTG